MRKNINEQGWGGAWGSGGDKTSNNNEWGGAWGSGGDKTSNDGFKQKQQSNVPPSSSGLPAWVNDYPCLFKLKITKTTSPNQVVFVTETGYWYFFNNFKFQFDSGYGNKIMGKWECESDGNLFIKTEDGEQWSSKDRKWVKQKSNDLSTQSGDKGQVSTKKTDAGGGTNNSGTTRKSKIDYVVYTKCSEQLPIKQYCKNETIRKVQACLKMPKIYQTGNFGPITQGYLESRNQNGTLITTETIINICGANHPLVPGVPYSSVPKTGYEDYTVDEIEYSNDVQNTKPSTPSSEKPEGEGTGYEGYSEENQQPVSPSTPPTSGQPIELELSPKQKARNAYMYGQPNN